VGKGLFSAVTLPLLSREEVLDHLANAVGKHGPEKPQSNEKNSNENHSFLDYWHPEKVCYHLDNEPERKADKEGSQENAHEKCREAQPARNPGLRYRQFTAATS